jgi:peptide subunit release factor RF-3
MSIKDFFVKKMLGSQLKKSGLPEAQQEKLMDAMMKNPELFQKIGKEIKELEKQGKNQVFASMEVMKKYQNELKELMM